MFAQLLLVGMLHAATPSAPEPALTPPPAEAEGHRVEAANPNNPLNYESDTPPPGRYDDVHNDEPLAPESRGLLAQLGRTLLALAAVVALIYIVAKLILPRVVRATGRGGSPTMRVVERLGLDPKHTLYIVEIDGRRLLVGTGESGVRLLTSLEHSKTSFGAAMDAQEGRDAQNQ